ncbi:MAG: phosphatidylglycerophosphatase A [Pseudomonadota bacterium]
MARVIATFFFVGLLKPAPGTWGSAAAALVALPIMLLGGPIWLAFGVALSFALGVWATAREITPSEPDPSRVVIDEVAGQWLALLPVAFMLEALGQGAAFYGASFLAFGAFRLFDIAKPWPVSWADKRHDAWGVMLDDILAGCLAGGCVWAILHVYLSYGV